MGQITSAMAAKHLKKLNDQRETLLYREQKAKAFTAAIQEDIESVRPAYDYAATQKEIAGLDAKIRKLKHTLNCFNSTYVIPELDMTIDQVLIYIPQLTARKEKLDSFRNRLPKERKESFGQKSAIIEYEYANYEIAQAQADYAAVTDELAKVQNALDRTNATVMFEAELE
ncbi:MAG: hypothetical protein J6U01_10225 [Clostridia bacterium]|nr:hypothetical protein [Clostridia bacterium]